MFSFHIIRTARNIFCVKNILEPQFPIYASQSAKGWQLERVGLYFFDKSIDITGDNDLALTVDRCLSIAALIPISTIGFHYPGFGIGRIILLIVRGDLRRSLTFSTPLRLFVTLRIFLLTLCADSRDVQFADRIQDKMSQYLSVNIATTATTKNTGVPNTTTNPPRAPNDFYRSLVAPNAPAHCPEESNFGAFQKFLTQSRNFRAVLSRFSMLPPPANSAHISYPTYPR